MKDGANFARKQFQEKAQAEIAELTRKVQKHKEAVKETESKSLYLEAYSRRENIKFVNIEEGPQDQPEDTEKILRGFLEHKLGYEDAQNSAVARPNSQLRQAGIARGFVLRGSDDRLCKIKMIGELRQNFTEASASVGLILATRWLLTATNQFVLNKTAFKSFQSLLNVGHKDKNDTV